ncbi:MAG TPA: MoaD/ThiS family protein [Allosphingosinicella sp.]|uniref:MoaD/ThiS family protein n=1 Tax=Allosphingosinicella sp. TaxID=2823234 RepID=UPI002ED84D6C
MASVRLLYFGYLADAAGTRGGSVDLPAHIGDTDQLLDWLEPSLAEELRRPSVRIVINNEIKAGTVPIHPGDEIGFIPPMSGG